MLGDILTKIFGAPSCPITDDDRAWIDHSVAWFVDQFGLDRLRASAVITPTVEYFPDSYGGSDDEVVTIFDRICGWMKIDPATIELYIYSGDEPPTLNPTTGSALVQHAAGLYYLDEDGKPTSKHGYLPEPMLGYALAAYAWLRGEAKPPWRKFLAYNVRAFFDRSMRYLRSVDGGTLATLDK